MQVFWAGGYEATTMTDLRQAMGIGRQSLYDTFGDKKEIFAAVLDRYITLSGRDIRALLGDENDNGIDGIQAFLNARAEILSEGVRRGCLMMNTCVELSAHEGDVASRIEGGLANLHLGFERALERAVSKGLLTQEADLSTLAAFLVTQVAGMVVMAKNHATRQQLQAVAAQALRALNC